MTNHLESSKMQILWRTKKHGWEFVTSRLKKTKGTWQLKVMYKNQSIDWMLNWEKIAIKSLYLVKDYTGACCVILSIFPLVWNLEE